MPRSLSTTHINVFFLMWLNNLTLLATSPGFAYHNAVFTRFPTSFRCDIKRSELDYASRLLHNTIINVLCIVLPLHIPDTTSLPQIRELYAIVANALSRSRETETNMRQMSYFEGYFLVKYNLIPRNLSTGWSWRHYIILEAGASLYMYHLCVMRTN